MSLSDELILLEAALREEKAAPEILAYRTSLVSVIRDLIELQQEALDHPIQTAKEKFQSALYQLDLDRTKFLLASYLRTRLFKIQRFVHYIVNKELSALLSDQELEFAEKYYIIKTNHFKKRFLSRLPKNVSTLGDEPYQPSPITEPPTNRYVFAKVLQEAGRLQLTPTDSISLSQGDVHLIPYSVAKPLLKNSTVQLL